MKKLIWVLCLCSFTLSQAQAPPRSKIIAYYTGDGEGIKKYPVHQLTHIIYSFMGIRNDTLGFRNDKQKQTLRDLVALKTKNPQLKIMVAIGGWGGCAPCSELFASAEHRVNFAKTTVALLKEYGADGLDLDWEYPVIEGYPGHKYDPADLGNFTELVKALRQEMGKDFLLSFAAGGFTKFLKQSIEWNKVAPLVDFINLMTYDLVGGFSKVTGHHTPLRDYNPDQQSTEKCVNWLLDHGVPSNKLIVGAAFYARVWSGVENINNGLYQTGTFLRGVPYRNFSTFFSDTSGYTYYWDKKAKAPYQYNATKKLYATFDDKKSIREKTKFIRRKKLAGMMFWELSQDDPKDGLVGEMYRRLKGG
ncbi:MAG: glycoside hydrolase family 18 protein [Saprospiraceae bacterium]|nr:glycoside hydrolase family 18 protein [Saprospiraceae bacterium]